MTARQAIAYSGRDAHDRRTNPPDPNGPRTRPVVTPLFHGGELADAARHAAPSQGWLDLSTGINPHPYPATLHAAPLARLPQRQDLDALLVAARAAYRVPDGAGIVAAPGTQAIIQWLPHLLPARDVVVVGPTYAEHAAAWRRTARVVEAAELRPADLAVVVRPNNPDGNRLPHRALTDYAAAAPGIRLVVDEAFGDLAPLETLAGAPGTLVLKSFGKFYGLPGVRLGFAIGPPEVTERLAEALGPWAVSAPALQVGAAALADAEWARAMRTRLATERAALDGALAQAGLTVVGGTDLFRLVETPSAAALHRALAERGIWTRRFEAAPTWLRIGLPGPSLPRLSAALADIGATAQS